jgi:hypothetical protein
MFDGGENWSSGEIMFERLYALSLTFDQRFNASVRQIAHIAQDLMTRGGSLGEKSIANPLDPSADEKFSRDLCRHHSNARFNYHIQSSTLNLNLNVKLA